MAQNPIEQKILELFTFNESLKFNEIEKLTRQRSNKIAYHLKQLVNKNILVRKEESYQLSETAENIVPYLSEKNSPLVVILIRIGDNKRCFLHKREKRPFLGKLSLPGGRILVNESIKEAVKRIMKEKYNINSTLQQVNSVSLEIVKRDATRKHSFFLILVTAKTKDKIPIFEVRKCKKDIIKSDYHLITSKDSKIEIKEFITPA